MAFQYKFFNVLYWSSYRPKIQMTEIIALKIKKEWVLTKTDKKHIKKLEKEGIIKDGKVVF